MTLLNSAGVYKITCIPTGKIYIGSTVQFRKRWNLHKVQLRKGKHHSPHLQNAWNKYGVDSFEFSILLVCDPSQSVFYEQIMLDAVKPAFNVCQVAGSTRGIRRSNEVKKRMSDGQRALNRKYTFQGQSMCLSEIAEATGFCVKKLTSRVLGLGKSIEEALTMPERVFTLYEHNGLHLTEAQWSRELGINAARLRHYLKRGLTIAQTIAAIDRSEKALSIRELCKLNGVSDATVKSRIKKGMSVMEAITTPIALTRSRFKQMEVA